MTKVMFGPYEPDVASVGMQSTAFVQNVFAAKDGYRPVPSLVPYSGPLTPIRGLFEATQVDGTTTIFAGTDAGLFRLNLQSLTWDDVSQAGGYHVLATEVWTFVQFGNLVIAATRNQVPQAFDLTSSDLFADLAGSPPNARSLVVVSDFVVLASLGSSPQSIQWSGLNDATFWTPGQRNSDFQEFPDGGAVLAVSGGEFGLVFQERAIRRMTFSPGSPEVFDFAVVSRNRGLVSPFAVVQSGTSTFFLSQDGFYRTDETGTMQPIGSDRVDATFFAEADLHTERFVLAVADARSQRVFWCYKTLANPNDTLDTALIYDWSLDVWSRAALNVAFVASLARPDYTLDTLDQVSTSLEAIPKSLDYYPGISLQSVAAVDSQGRLCFMNGPPLEATLDTPEGNIDGAVRTFVRGAAPIGDAPAAMLSLFRRDRLIDPKVQTVETGLGITGFAPQRSDARFHIGRLRIPAASNWSFVRGVDVDAIPRGKR